MLGIWHIDVRLTSARKNFVNSLWNLFRLYSPHYDERRLIYDEVVYYIWPVGLLHKTHVPDQAHTFDGKTIISGILA